MKHRNLALIAAAIAAAATFIACSNQPTALDSWTCDSPIGSGPVQQLVDAAQPGDIITLPAGVYHESITVTTANITLRGENRNTVIFDGCRTQPHGILVTANEVTVENLTVHSYFVNGVFFNGASSADDTTPLDGFAVRYVTASNNGLYGIYLFQASNGTVTDSYMSGHPDSGLYVGQCDPCNTLIDNVTAESNAIGYEGTNASAVWVVNSRFVNNRIGMTPNSQNLERYAPQTGAFIAGNVISDNNNPDSPEQASGGFGIGVAVGGGNSNVVANNRIERNTTIGVVVTSLDGFNPANNEISNNKITNNGVDIGYWIDGSQETPTAGNRFAGNQFASSTPPNIETVMANTTVNAEVLVLQPGPAGIDWDDMTLPRTRFESLPTDAPTAPARFDGPFPTLDQIETP